MPRTNPQILIYYQPSFILTQDPKIAPWRVTTRRVLPTFDDLPHTPQPATPAKAMWQEVEALLNVDRLDAPPGAGHQIAEHARAPQRT